MLLFDPQDPYPRLQNGAPSASGALGSAAASYAQAQAHAARVDEWLGLRTEEVEQALKRANGTTRKEFHAQQLWIGLPVQAMLTPYTELRSILDRLHPSPGQCVIDLGAGYGRMGFVMARHFPGVRFLGYEYVTERVHEGRRCLQAAGALPPAIRLEQADLSDPTFAPEASDFYFLYDYGTREAIEKTLQDLRLTARSRPITVVGRGRASRDAIERAHPWLSQVHQPEHAAHISIYRSG